MKDPEHCRKRDFSLLSKSLVLFNRIFSGSFILQKDNKTERLRNKENFRTTKPQEHVKLMIDSANTKKKASTKLQLGNLRKKCIMETTDFRNTKQMPRDTQCSHPRMI
jgi:hypothetical protein